MADLSFTFVTRLDDNRIKLVERISGLKFNKAMGKILNEGNAALIMSKFLERIIDDWIRENEQKRKEVKSGKPRQSKGRR